MICNNAPLSFSFTSRRVIVKWAFVWKTDAVENMVITTAPDGFIWIGRGSMYHKAVYLVGLIGSIHFAVLITSIDLENILSRRLV